MTTFQMTDDPTLSVQIKRHRRARRLSLRVSSVDGRVTLTIPPHVSDREARAFASEKSSWLRKAVARSHSAVPVIIGASLPIAGQPCPVIEGQGRAARLVAGQIEAPLQRPGPAIRVLLQHLARERLGTAARRFADALGETPGRITLRDTRSRWGSCTSDGNLMFSWRLVLAPLDVLDYVAAHEVAHLRHMDHSARFWGAVDALYPDYDTPRQWLRENGASLHRYRFETAAD